MNGNPINLVLLETFHHVAQTGSLTRTAEILGRSQPAISHRMRALEAELGVPLFEKVGRRLMPTEYGLRLQVECRDLMAMSQHVRDRVVRSEEAQGRVAIGTFIALASHLLVPALSAIVQEHPKVQLSLQFDFIPALCRRLRAGELDVLVLAGDFESAAFDVHTIGHTSLVAAFAPALTDKTRVSPRWLRDKRYLAYGGPGDPTFETIDVFAREHGLVSPTSPSIPNIEALRELAAAGAGYTFLPEYTTRRDVELGRLRAVRVTGLTTALPIAIVGRRGQVRAPALRAVEAALRTMAPEGDPKRRH